MARVPTTRLMSFTASCEIHFWKTEKLTPNHGNIFAVICRNWTKITSDARKCTKVVPTSLNYLIKFWIFVPYNFNSKVKVAVKYSILKFWVNILTIEHLTSRLRLYSVGTELNKKAYSQLANVTTKRKEPHARTIRWNIDSNKPLVSQGLYSSNAFVVIKAIPISLPLQNHILCRINHMPHFLVFVFRWINQACGAPLFLLLENYQAMIWFINPCQVTPGSWFCPYIIKV